MFPSVYQHRLAAWFQLTLPSPGIWVRDHTSLGLDLYSQSADHKKNEPCGLRLLCEITPHRGPCTGPGTKSQWVALGEEVSMMLLGG